MKTLAFPTLLDWGYDDTSLITNPKDNVGLISPNILPTAIDHLFRRNRVDLFQTLRSVFTWRSQRLDIGHQFTACGRNTRVGGSREVR